MRYEKWEIRNEKWGNEEMKKWGMRNEKEEMRKWGNEKLELRKYSAFGHV